MIIQSPPDKVYTNSSIWILKRKTNYYIQRYYLHHYPTTTPSPQLPLSTNLVLSQNLHHLLSQSQRSRLKYHLKHPVNQLNQHVNSQQQRLYITLRLTNKEFGPKNDYIIVFLFFYHFICHYSILPTFNHKFSISRSRSPTAAPYS